MVLSANDPRLLPVHLRQELLRSGHSDRSLAAALASGTFERPRRGAYVDGPSWRALTAEQRFAVRCRAVYRQATADVVLSHVAALSLNDGPLWGFPLDEVDLTRLDGLSGRREAGVRRHCGVVLPGDVVAAHGVRTTSPLRATVEVSMLGATEAALSVANHFLNRGDFAVGDLRERYKRSMEQWPGSVASDLVIRLADPRIESVGESRTAYFLFRRGFPKPIPQYEVLSRGVLVGRLDFAFPELGLWIEFDGRVKYERYLRPGESAADAVLREKRREQDIAEATGWRCFRIAWADLGSWDALEARLVSFIDSVARERSRRTAS